MQRHFPVIQSDVEDALWQQGPKVDFVAPVSDWERFVTRPLPSFAPIIRDFVAVLSARLQKEGRENPDLAAFGFWLRPRQLEGQSNRIAGRAPLGMVFHLVPSNVPTVAFYSWIMALLMGNASVVRLSSRIDPVQQAMLAILNELFSLQEWQEIASRTRFIRYDHDEHVTAWFSRHCRLRIVWGGDETIRGVRAIPLSPRAQEVVFPDRRSMAVFDSQWLACLDAAKWLQTVAALQQDFTRFNQQACASPTTICWLGNPDSTLRRRLIEAIFAPFAEDAAMKMERFIKSQQNVADDGGAELDVFAGVSLLSSTKSLGLKHVGGGTVAEFVADTLEDVLVQPWDMQTCVWAGPDKMRFERAILVSPACRIDRLASPGQALAFEWFWDGIDMLVALSRLVARF